MSMRMWTALLFGAVVAAASTHAIAESSTAIVEPGPGGATLIPSKPLVILDTDYPLESLLANEEGNVRLGFAVDSTGHPVNMQVLSSSGVPRLDQQAAQIARTRWQFQPTVSDDAAQLTIEWRLPLEVVPKMHVDIPAAPEGATPPKPANSHAIKLEDYPGDSIRLGERGTTILRYLVQENGSVGEIQLVASSSYPRLDDAASRIVKRWTFEPAQSGGSAVKFWSSVSVNFGIVSGRGEAMLHCYERPDVGDDAQEKVVLTASLIGGSNVRVIDRWGFVTRERVLSDLVIGTDKGLMRMSKPLLAQMAQSVQYPRPDKPAGCWYHDQIPLGR